MQNLKFCCEIAALSYDLTNHLPNDSKKQKQTNKPSKNKNKNKNKVKTLTRCSNNLDPRTETNIFFTLCAK